MKTHICSRHLHGFKRFLMSQLYLNTRLNGRNSFFNFSNLVINTLILCRKLDNSAGVVLITPSPEKRLHTISTTAASHCVGTDANVTLFFSAAKFCCFSFGWFYWFVFPEHTKLEKANQSFAQTPTGIKPSKPLTVFVEDKPAKNLFLIIFVKTEHTHVQEKKPNFPLILLAQALEELPAETDHSHTTQCPQGAETSSTQSASDG